MGEDVGMSNLGNDVDAQMAELEALMAKLSQPPKWYDLPGHLATWTTRRRRAIVKDDRTARRLIAVGTGIRFALAFSVYVLLALYADVPTWLAMVAGPFYGWMAAVVILTPYTEARLYEDGHYWGVREGGDMVLGLMREHEEFMRERDGE
jgi:hypothetical protein